MRKLIYLVATSVDGFIADREGNYDMFSQDPAVLRRIFAEYPETCPAHVQPLLGITDPPRHFDTVLMGARTHEPALRAGLTSAYPHLRQFVVTHQTDLPADDSLSVVQSDPLKLVRRLKQEDGLDIWLCGGATLAGQLVEEIDEFHLKLNPVLIGDGIPLVQGRQEPLSVKLTRAADLDGVHLMVYSRT